MIFSIALFWRVFQRKTRWHLGLHPRPRLGSSQRSPIPPSWAGGGACSPSCTLHGAAPPIGPPLPFAGSATAIYLPFHFSAPPKKNSCLRPCTCTGPVGLPDRVASGSGRDPHCTPISADLEPLRGGGGGGGGVRSNPPTPPGYRLVVCPSLKDTHRHFMVT